MKEPTQLLAYLRVENDVLIADVLQLGSELWLVTEWSETQDGQWQTPARAIRIDQRPHQREPCQGADLVLNETLPKAVLGDQPPAGFPCLRGQQALDRFGWLRRSAAS